MNQRFNFHLLQYGWKPLFWTLVTLVGGLSLTAYSLHSTRQRLHTEAELQFGQRLDRLEASIRAQFNQPLSGIRGAIGAQASTGDMRRANFRAYVAARDLATEFPGIRGFGYIERVMRPDIGRFEATEQTDQAPDFAVNTRGDAPDLYVIKYIEPLAGNREALGLDLGAEPIRREAVERAIDTGEPSLSGPIALIQDGRKGPGFLYLVPVFPEGTTPDTPQARRARLAGLFFSPLVMNELLSISAAATNGMVDFELFDGPGASPQTLVFSSQRMLGAGVGMVEPIDFTKERAFYPTRILRIGGRQLLLRAGSSAVFESQLDHNTPWLVGAGGAVLSLLLAAITWLLLIGRARAETLARAMTSDLDRLVGVHKTTNEKLGEAVRESQALMEAIDQHSIVSIADPAGNIIGINDKFCSISGYSREELLGQSHRVVKSEAQPNEFWSAMWKTISSGYTWRDVVCNRAKDGSLYWVDTSISPFFDASGAIEKYISIHTDVTAARLAQQAVLTQRERLNNIILGTNAGTWEWNVATGEIVINERWAGMIGYTQQELGPVSLQTWTTHCHPDDRQQADLLLARCVEGDLDYYDCEYRMRHREGHWVWIQARGKISSRTADGAPEGMSGTLLDISKQKHAEAEIARTTAMLQSMLDATTEVAVITTGLDRIITVFNKGAERMLGYVAADVVGRYTTAVFTDPQEIAAHNTALAVELGRPVADFAVAIDDAMLGRKMEWTYIRKDGSRLAVSLVITPLLDAAGVRTGYLGLSHDISAEKAYENELRAAMQQAEAATLAKGQFLANMSHEIRTPMNAILGMLRLLQNTGLSPRQQDYAGKTERAAKSLLGLLNDILDFSKMDAGKMTLDRQPFRLDRLLRDLSVILSASVGNKPVEVLFDIDPATPKALLGDALRLQQVLVNLAGNAIKFTAQGEVVIQIRVLAQTGPDTTLRIAVRDSGIGIAPEHQQHIFDGFSQAEASTTRRFGGTGLGLSISRRLVRLMGAELALDSVPGRGSTFYFTVTLPATEHVPDEPDRPAATQTLTGLNVLVVDDNARAREVLVSMAQSWGWHADAAGSGVEAIHLIEARARSARTPYQAIFVDWQMPGMDGWETSLRIRQLPPAAGAPIIVMVTAHGREMLAQRTAEEQARLNGFLVKPVTASMLFNAVADARAEHDPLRVHPKAHTAAQRRLEGLRLLVVEDNLINQQVAQELLSAEGALVELAANGQLGVAAVASARPPFDVVLMDIQMPVMDGYSATRAIRQKLRLSELPIIAMTANAMAADREACLAAGMNDHVGKPFDLPHLIRVVRSHVKLASDAMPANGTASEPAPALPAVEAVNVSGALARLGGNTELYARILRSYLGDISRLPDQFDAFLQHGDLSAAARLLHTLKGLSATVGAEHLATVASTAESILQGADATRSPDDLRTRLREAVAATGRILDQVAQNLPQPAPPPIPATAQAALDGTRLVADLRELQGLLKMSDMRALDVHAQLHQTHAKLPAGTLDELDAALAALDFAQGVLQCEALIRKCSPPI
jgi:PAS domain S-box-containing protein